MVGPRLRTKAPENPEISLLYVASDVLVRGDRSVVSTGYINFYYIISGFVCVSF